MGARIKAWRPHENADALEPCAANDILATRWDVHYDGAAYGMAMAFTDFAMAQKIAFALDNSFEAGKDALRKEFRQFMRIGE